MVTLQQQCHIAHFPYDHISAAKREMNQILVNQPLYYYEQRKLSECKGSLVPLSIQYWKNACKQAHK